ncbi:MAG: hypothetical protein DRN04_00810 [Thermoprotei archaeon]|nr:MAG: hypothetical protein DRN04_00810 [Thermoprotei archaeon]
MSSEVKRFKCFACGREITVPYGVPKPAYCPYCGAPEAMIHRLDKGPHRRGRGRGGPPWAKKGEEF